MNPSRTTDGDRRGGAAGTPIVPRPCDHFVARTDHPRPARDAPRRRGDAPDGAELLPQRGASVAATVTSLYTLKIEPRPRQVIGENT